MMFYTPSIHGYHPTRYPEKLEYLSRKAEKPGIPVRKTRETRDSPNTLGSSGFSGYSGFSGSLSSLGFSGFPGIPDSGGGDDHKSHQGLVLLQNGPWTCLHSVDIMAGVY